MKQTQRMKAWNAPNNLRGTFGHPKLPTNPTMDEVIQWIRDKAIWEDLQPHGGEMDAREWAATVLNGMAEDLEASIRHE